VICTITVYKVEFVTRHYTIIGRSRATVCCKVNCRKISDLAAVEGALVGVQLANSLNRLDEQGEVPGTVCEPFHRAGEA